MSTETDTDFESAFAAAMGEPVTEAAEVETLEEPVVDEPEDVVDEVVAEEGADDGEPVEAEPEVVAEDPAPVEAAAPAAPQPLDPKFLAQAIAEEQENRRLAAETAATQQEQTKQQEKDFTAEDFLDENQKKAVELLNSEWSEVAGPVQALIAANVQAALANQKREILTQVQQQMAPIQQATVKSQEAMHWGSIAAAHPDYQTVAESLPEWIESQPFKVAQQYMAAYQGGSTAEVVALISAYKQAIGSTGAAPAHPASSAVQATPRVAPVSKAALAATAAPPRAQRSTVTTSRDPGDFESAFAEAVAR